ncbi:septation protein SepH [Sinomonas sp. ASV486]|uniref:septation protein SepH n=1 Tax=Sinomonas sp. ASV486 TaxID=3051170 RepID=UPI0027DD9A92|nr:septation protein SepH [Sinomonas sp. ASV486]MDQ4489690.1 septation protein SepH [Sinomonas sp. ASV486]
MRERAQDQAQELRLVGVHEDGAHLLVSAANGDVFRLPLDEALRRAVSRPAPQRPATGDGAGMTPRQIQAEIRGGATAEEVAVSSGIPLARVQRFEGPVLAEREHVARRAQGVEVPGRLPTHDALRGPQADRPATLGEMAAYRLSLHGVSADSVEWDSWRRPDGQWTVVARFELPDGAPSSIGEEPPAMWTYHPIHRTVANANRWAQQLSELEPLDGPAPRRRLAAVSDRPFDVEAPEAMRRAEAALPTPLDREAELLDMLRARRGQRLGVDEDGDDALALLLTHGIPAAHPRPSDADAADADDDAEVTDGAERHDRPTRPGSAADDDRVAAPRGGITSLLSRLNPRVHEGDDSLGLKPGISTATHEITLVPSAHPPGPDHQSDGQEHTSGVTSQGGSSPEDAPYAGAPSNSESRPTESRGPEIGRPESTQVASGSADSARPEPRQSGPGTEAPRRSGRPKRSSVPSWDEIVFGTKGD